MTIFDEDRESIAKVLDKTSVGVLRAALKGYVMRSNASLEFAKLLCEKLSLSENQLFVVVLIADAYQAGNDKIVENLDQCAKSK